jgi:hypothetical protein
MSEHGDRIRQLEKENRWLHERLTTLEAQMRGELSDEWASPSEPDEDEYSYYEPSDETAFNQPHFGPSGYSDSGPMTGSSQSLPRGDDHPSRSRYNKATSNGDTFEADIARYAHSRNIHGETPVDAGLNAVSRFRKSRTKV